MALCTCLFSLVGVRGPPRFLSKFLKPLSIPYTQEKPHQVRGKINSVSKSHTNKRQLVWSPTCIESQSSVATFSSSVALLPQLSSPLCNTPFFMPSSPPAFLALVPQIPLECPSRHLFCFLTLLILLSNKLRILRTLKPERWCSSTA